MFSQRDRLNEPFVCARKRRQDLRIVNIELAERAARLLSDDVARGRVSEALTSERNEPIG
ncbi:MAG TPA: hypothetical protein VM345_08410 [Acidimicrobiales bacterium]|nr:hypothetical protein [Acidimicrobiales bacterium]